VEFRAGSRDVDRIRPGISPLPAAIDPVIANPLVSRHGAVRLQIVIAHPDITGHRAAFVKVVPLPAYLLPPRFHGVIRCVEVIPNARDSLPARNKLAPAVGPIPLRAAFHPAGCLGTFRVLEEVGRVSDDLQSFLRLNLERRLLMAFVIPCACK